MKTKSFEESLKKKFIKQKYNQKKPKRKKYKKIGILDISVSFRSSSARLCFASSISNCFCFSTKTSILINSVLKGHI